MDERYGTEVFTDPTIRGKLGVNAMKAKKHLYDHVVFDSTNERDFAAELDTNTDVAVYVKLPDGFYISTPVGHYNPDWAIAFYEGKVKHIYFVAETKGSMLLYAKTEEAITPDCSFVIGGNKISVKTVDLNKEFKLIAAQLDKIAEDYFGKKRIEDSII